ncbi:MAG: hypothetical protein ACR2HX_16705 [Pyrinomonadaceae bacterium]
MTDSELRDLFEAANRRFEELTRKHEMGFGLTRRDLLELRECNNRLHVVAYELWIAKGQPSGPEFDCLKRPIPKRPLPKSMQPLNLTMRNDPEVLH